MSCAEVCKRARGFTLLEVLIAVVITAMLLMGVYSFVRSTLKAIATAEETSRDRQQMAALIDYIRAQLEDLPARTQGALVGNPGRYHDLASDEMQWLCRAGPGVLTTSAPDEYRVTLAIQPVEKSKEQEIGLRRRPTNLDERNYNWLPLMRPAAALEIRYYDPRLNAWIERWSDSNLLPVLVKVRVWRSASEDPLEAVLSIPSARTQGVGQ